MRLALLALFTLTLVGCSDVDDPTRSSSAGDSTQTAPPATASPAQTETPTPTAVPPAPEGGPEASGERAMEHLRYIATEIGPRTGGSGGESEVADYVADTLRSYGYDAEVQSFEFEGNRFPNGRIETDALTIDGIAMTGSIARETSGPLRYAGLGSTEEMQGLDLDGAIVLTDRGVVTFGDRYRNALEAGAAGLIVINNVPGPLVNATLGVDSVFPVVGVSAEEGLALMEAAENGATATVRSEGATSEAANVVARVNGARCELLVGGHHDSVPGTQGANDNASGVSLVLEIARAMAADGLDEGLCFATFGAEESGLHGSRHMAAEMQTAGEPAVMVNLDVTGRGLPVEAIGDADLIGLALETGEKLGIETIPSNLPANTGSDHMSFSQLGVRVLFFASGDYSDIHTPQDTFERIEPGTLDAVLQVAHASVSELYLQLAAP
jgi:aminopeptidase YwaD